MTTTPSSTNPAVRIGMQFGPEWFDLPRGEADLDRISAEVDARIQRDPAVSEHRDLLLDLLMSSAEQARRRRAVAAALRVDHHELDVVSMASLHLTVHRAAAASVEERIRALQDQLAGEVGEAHAESVSEVRELPAGRALRVQVIGQAREANDIDAVPLAENVQYWLPLLDQPVNLLVFYSTPNVAGAEPLVAELDQMMETLRIVV